MRKTTRIVVMLLVLVTGLLFLQFVVRSGPTEGTHFAEKANLALRRTAHQLLVTAGDSTSGIPPVQQADANTFLVRFNRSFPYDALPGTLQQSLRVHGITADYDVAVRDCANGVLQLGYTAQDLTEKKGVACTGREHAKGCYTLQVRFARPESGPRPGVWWVMAGASVLLAGLVFALRRKEAPAECPAEDAVSEKNGTVRFGSSSLDSANQVLLSGSNRHKLTYREAKLLRLFAEHPDQLLERDFILKAVWEDEGIIVGRSVDVFVSRLRKLLQDDVSVRIAAVHGVGYRLETRTHGL
ncbi:winged helix-turn-helix domain-containing protein [Larkinella sp. VNQ87]|uniref:winged helix-turn-helix domain-containing protein n=1 Tax=Larkinella sp. VNQ87 TaxID=3400921 RepID=UPI003BFFFA13